MQLRVHMLKDMCLYDTEHAVVPTGVISSLSILFVLQKAQ